MIRNTLVATLGLSALTAMAQMTPVGLWKTIDDKDGSAKSEIRIVDNGGVVSGKIERDLSPKAKPDDKCTAGKERAEIEEMQRHELERLARRERERQEEMARAQSMHGNHGKYIRQPLSEVPLKRAL